MFYLDVLKTYSRGSTFDAEISLDLNCSRLAYMANRVKEDEKHERIIRGLLKLQENRRCINCNSLVHSYFLSHCLDFFR